MIRMSLPWLIAGFQAADELKHVSKGMTYGQAWGNIYSAKTQLEALFQQSFYRGSLLSSRQSADALYETLNQFLISEQDEPVNDIHDWQLKFQREQFRTVFLAELGTMPSFFVMQKPPYDTNILLDGGETVMPPELGAKVPEAVFDAKEAARCLAYEMSTASGFHAFRLLESVVRRYYKELTGGNAEPKQRNLGVYIRALKDCGKADAKVIATLTQLKDLHRNPLAHPQVALRPEEAISILGLVRSAVGAMLDLLPEPPLTTTTAGA